MEKERRNDNGSLVCKTIAFKMWKKFGPIHVACSPLVKRGLPAIESHKSLKSAWFKKKQLLYFNCKYWHAKITSKPITVKTRNFEGNLHSNNVHVRTNNFLWEKEKVAPSRIGAVEEKFPDLHLSNTGTCLPQKMEFHYFMSKWSHTGKKERRVTLIAFGSPVVEAKKI